MLASPLRQQRGLAEARRRLNDDHRPVAKALYLTGETYLLCAGAAGRVGRLKALGSARNLRAEIIFTDRVLLIEPESKAFLSITIIDGAGRMVAVLFFPFRNLSGSRRGFS